MASAWDGYLVTLKAPNPVTTVQEVMDAAIVGQSGGVWCASGSLKNITDAEIKKILTTDRSSLFASGVTVAGLRCTVLRDEFEDPASYMLKLKSKSSDTDSNTYFISIYKTATALVLVKGEKDAQGANINERAYKIGQYLRDSGS